MLFTKLRAKGMNKKNEKFLIVALAFVACAYADVSELGYNYEQPAAPAPAPVAPASVAPVNTYVPPAPVAPAPANVAPPKAVAPAPAPVAPIVEPTNTYIPPAPVATVEEVEQTPVDGYRYKTVRRVVYRHRKFLIVALAFVACAYADVSELGYKYQKPAAPAPAPVAPAPAPVAPVNTYVPPAPVAPAPAPVAPAPAPVAPAPAPVAPAKIVEPFPAPVAPVVEPTNTYIPPAPVAPIEEVEQTPVDGYRYKTVRRVVYRHRA
ncbi:uncharacterized protein [Musca autumnalis]|uniref:uncharacterized protein n=1 Tax=Musca autumnalis TaxID=221902 RepID=UPI003CF56FD4